MSVQETPHDNSQNPHDPIFSIRVWHIFVCLFLVFAYEVWLLRIPRIAFEALHYLEYYLVAFLVGVIGTWTIWRALPTRLRRLPRISVTLPFAITFLVFANLISQHMFALHACFRASETQLDELADGILSDPAKAKVKLETSAGFYQIKTGQIINNAVVLRLDDPTVADDGYGFIRIPENHMDPINGESFEMRGVELKHLSGRWYVYYSYYRSIKTGWS